MTSRIIYKLLTLDPGEKTLCENAQSLLYILRGFSRLWKNPRVDEQATCITDGNNRLDVAEVIHPHDSDSGDAAPFGRAFEVTLSGSFDEIEPLREPLTGYLKAQEFDLLYVLKDEASEYIACQLYPHLYRIENLVRQYLIKFMATRIGPTWWEVTASREMSDKVKMRKKNERVFGKHVENSAFLIDFDELGEIIYEQSSGFVTREDILKRINKLPETAEALVKLKGELRSNYQKFFKESFADRDFKAKWQEFETLRNKIAHNNLFTGEDLKRGQQLAQEILDLVSQAEAQTSQLIITPEDREAIQDTVVEGGYAWRGGYAWKEISAEEFLEQLSKQQVYFHRGGGFVGLARFVKSHLTGLGYDVPTSYELADRLRREQKVEIYYVDNPQDDHQTAAIRLISGEGDKTLGPTGDEPTN